MINDDHRTRKRQMSPSANAKITDTEKIRRQPGNEVSSNIVKNREWLRKTE